VEGRPAYLPADLLPAFVDGDAELETRSAAHVDWSALSVSPMISMTTRFSSSGRSWR
jgi:hypothetical protein